VVARITCADEGRFSPYPYKPKNIARLIRNADLIVSHSDFERKYRRLA